MKLFKTPTGQCTHQATYLRISAGGGSAWSRLGTTESESLLKIPSSSESPPEHDCGSWIRWDLCPNLTPSYDRIRTNHSPPTWEGLGATTHRHPPHQSLKCSRGHPPRGPAQMSRVKETLSLHSQGGTSLAAMGGALETGCDTS